MNSGEIILIRPLRHGDLPALEWDGEYSHFRRLYQKHYQNSLMGGIQMWVCENPVGLIVGQFFLQLDQSSRNNSKGKPPYLFSFRIRPLYRHQGLGSFILNCLEEYLQSFGYNFLCLNVSQKNEEALRLYKEHGYNITGSNSGVWSYQDQNNVWQTVIDPAWEMLKKL